MQEVDHGDEVAGGAVAAGAGLGGLEEGGGALDEAVGDPGLEPAQDSAP